MSVSNTMKTPNLTNPKNLTITAYQGDAKTLLAFNLPQANSAGLAGFSIQAQPHGHPAYYLLNKLLLPAGPAHATLPGEPADSTANAPIQKYRWLHVPGSFHQGDNVFYGVYTYTVTPRYFKNGALQPLDPSLSATVDIQVGPYVNGQLELGFTRGFVQSQAFATHFGLKTPFRPAARDLLFDTTQKAGTNPAGQSFTFQQEYQWSGFTARQKVFDTLNNVLSDPSLSIDVFAYDLDEPDVMNIFLKLAAQDRIRIILDNATLHHDTSKPTPEDQFEQAFQKAVKTKTPAALLRGKFGRFAHDKVIIVYKNTGTSAGKAPLSVLTGSTNFSITGLYVNSNHVLVFNSADVAALYSKVFNESWNDNVSESFSGSTFAAAPFPFNQKGLPKMSITFSPHSTNTANSILDAIATRIGQETSSVLFAVMDVTSGGGNVLKALQQEHARQDIFSYGISDSPGNSISLYKPGNKEGVLVTGKPGQTNLPPPFNQEETVGIGHQIHHKFIICGFNTPNAVVWCGSSNLAAGGEAANGDNLLQINDSETATVFAIEALGLVDHFDFRDAHTVAGAGGPHAAPPAAGGKKTAKPKAPATPVHKSATPAPPPAKGKATSAPLPTAGSADPHDTLTLNGDDTWVKRYYDPNDLYCKDRLLFGKTS